MIYNICDLRSNNKKTDCDAVLEIDCHDWYSHNLPRDTQDYTTWIGESSIYHVLTTAWKHKGLVTVYLYDAGKIAKEFAHMTWLHHDIPEEPLNIIDALRKNLLK